MEGPRTLSTSDMEHGPKKEGGKGVEKTLYVHESHYEARRAARVRCIEGFALDIKALQI